MYIEVGMRLPLKILFLFEDLCLGGTQKQNLELACRLDRKIFNPSILTLTGPTDLDERALEADINLAHLGRGRKPHPFFFAQLKNRLASIRPDILIPCTALPNIWGRIWGRFLKIPLIIGTCRGGGAPMRQHEWILWRLCQHIICNSTALVEAMQLKGVPPGILTYIPNGVDSNAFSPDRRKKEDDAPLITCVARLAKDKDHATLIRAFAVVATKNPAARLRLVGAGPEEQNLHELVARELSPEAATRVEFAGASLNAACHYARTDIFALASIREGQPNVILEAMSAGLPVCATCVGGIPALVRPGQTGLLCQPKDAEGLAANILMLLEQPELRKQFGHNARLRIENDFSFEKMVEAHQELFLKLWKNLPAQINGGAR